MAARHLLHGGLQRSIGTGAETKVWEDVWIPESPARPAIPRSNAVDKDLKVHHLIDYDRKEWNLDLVHEFIAPIDIPKVLAIKLSRTRRRDDYIWSFTKSGKYTVRSGYAIAVNLRKERDGTATLEPSTTGLKKSIWKLQCPRKLKHFLWNVVSGYVASASKLKERHCGNDAVCQRCGSDQETINHILFECPPAVQCWALSLIPTAPGLFPCTSVYANLDNLLSLAATTSRQNESIKTFPWVMWYIWKARNEKCFNAKDVSPLDTLQTATHEAEAWRIAQIVEENREATPAEDRERQTEVLQAPYCKWTCQVDASWKAKDEGAGLGFILFEDNQVRLVGLRNGSPTASPLHAEAESICWALKEIKKLGVCEVLLNSDCQLLVNLINNPQEWPALGPELDEIDFLCSEFSFLSVKFIRRTENVRADCLSKAGRSREPGFCFVGDNAPSWLAHEACLSRPLVF